MWCGSAKSESKASPESGPMRLRRFRLERPEKIGSCLPVSHEHAVWDKRTGRVGQVRNCDDSEIESNCVRPSQCAVHHPGN